jgi:mRNA interferase MazF
MYKDYTSWNNLKTAINNNQKRILFQEREVWWCHLGVNVGDEQDGKGSTFKRPVVILRKYSAHIFVAVPLSSKIKDTVYNYIFDFKEIQQCALLSQARLLDAKRLSHKMGRLPMSDYNNIKEKLEKLLFRK